VWAGAFHAAPKVRAVPSLLAGALLTALAAQASVSIPGSPVPQSLQTLAVVVVGGALGAGGGGAAMLLYLAMGVAGLPVFADGGSGLARLWGPTSGFLAGFVVGAALMGWWAGRPYGRRYAGLTAGAVAAHGVILFPGWGRLALDLGAGEAWAQGVAPFLWGGLVKSLAGAAILVVWGRWRRGRAGDREGTPGRPGPVEPGTPPV
jgi:biotin transport system substrate-specific component